MSKIIILLPAIVLLVVGYQFKDSIRHLPRVRVGPLHAEKEAASALKFFVFGDSGSGRPEQMAVAAAMEKRCSEAGPFDGILMLGDNVYMSGVSSTEDELWQDRVFRPYGSDCLEKLPIYAILGNHDYKGNPAAQIEMTLINKRWYMPNRFYSLRFGSLLSVIAFDSEMSEFCFSPGFCTYDYLMKAVKDYPATWTFVLSHHPLISSSAHGYGHTGGFRKYLIKPFVCNKADLWLSGHAHHLEHAVEPGCRIEYFLSGGAGASLYAVEAGHPNVQYVESVHGFLELAITTEKVTAEFYDSLGQLKHHSEKLPFQRR